MTQLLSPPKVARLLGVANEQVREWARRSEDPLPSVMVGSTGKHRRIVAAELKDWLAREAERGRPASARPRRRRP